MTQDDTFRILSQRPYDEVKQKLIRFQQASYRCYQTSCKDFLKKNGWTITEWNNALAKDPQCHSDIGGSEFYRKYFV